jgi:hypothetical protein
MSELYDDPILRNRIFSTYNSIKAVSEDLLVIKDRESNLKSRMEDLIHNNKWPNSYTIEEIQEK